MEHWITVRMRVLTLVIILTLWTGLAAAATTHTVTSSLGDASPGTFTDILNQAADGDTILFADGVTRIVLDNEASTYREGLTITGRAGTLASGIEALLLTYGIDVASGTADFSSLDISNTQDIWQEINALTLPSVVLEVDNAVNADQRALNLLGFGGTSNTLTLLTIQNIVFTTSTPNVDHSSGGGSADTNWNVYGGGLAAVAASTLEMAFSHIKVTTTAGDATGEDGVTDAYATATANTYGGGAYLRTGSVTSSLFHENSIIANGGTANGGRDASYNAFANAKAAAYGGGVYLDGDVTSSLFYLNSITANGGSANGGDDAITQSEASSDANSLATASGGGAYLSTGSITSSLFHSNSVTANGGMAKGGEYTIVSSGSSFAFASSTAFAAATASGGGGRLDDGGLVASVFRSNSVSASGGEANGGTNSAAYGTDTAQVLSAGEARAEASGGGAYLNNGGVTSSLFHSNSVTSKGGTANAGGDASISLNSNTNNAQAYLYASAYANAFGGGAYLVSGDVASSQFHSNSITANGGVAIGANGNATATNNAILLGIAYAFANASGGGAYVTDGDIENSLFQRNSVTATGGARAHSDVVIGGDVYTWANADAYAFGGGAYVSGDNVVVEDSSFLGNSVTATADGSVYQYGLQSPERKPEAIAAGGAVFFDTVESSKSLTLSASAGNRTVIRGNTANGVGSGIHFGRGGGYDAFTGYFKESGANTEFTVNVQGDVFMYDPVTVEVFNTNPGGATFAMTVGVDDSTGRFVWGGENVLDANGGSSVDFTGGTTILAADYTLTTSDRSAAGLNGYRTGSDIDAYARAAGDNDLTVKLSAGSVLNLAGNRESTLAAFDFAKTSNGTFTTENGAVIGLDTDRLLFSVDRDYLVAADLTGADLAAALGNLVQGNAVTDIFGRDNNSLWIAAQHTSRFDPVMRRWSNLLNAGAALEALLGDYALTSDAQFDAVTRHLASATPSQAANSAVAALGLSGRVASKAVELSDPAAGRDPCLSEFSQRARPAVRLWGGYLGSLERMDSHGGYQGYKHYSNGALVGGNVDFAAASVGAYFGYTRSRLNMRDDANGRVTADGYHTGLTASAAPVRELPNLRLSGDVGFAYYDTSSRRYDGSGSVSGSASQRSWTAGLAARYDACVGPVAITPFASFRWTGIRQNALTERGGLTAARVDKMSGDSLASELGVRVSRTWNGLTPYALVGWRHEFGDRDVAATAIYHENQTMRYRISSVERDRDAVLLGAGLTAKRTLASGREIGGTVGYAASVGSHGTEHAIAATVGLSF